MDGVEKRDGAPSTGVSNSDRLMRAEGQPSSASPRSRFWRSTHPRFQLRAAQETNDVPGRSLTLTTGVFREPARQQLAEDLQL